MTSDHSAGEPPLAARRLLTVDQVAEFAQVNSRTVRRLIKKGRLRVVRLGRSVRIHPEDLDALLQSN
jgi:excisionase family DNA binding protein